MPPKFAAAIEFFTHTDGLKERARLALLALVRLAGVLPKSQPARMMSPSDFGVGAVNGWHNPLFRAAQRMDAEGLSGQEIEAAEEALTLLMP